MLAEPCQQTFTAVAATALYPFFHSAGRGILPGCAGLPLHIPAGLQHMDGAEALAFMRERHDLPLADISREANQQELLAALKAQLLRRANLVHIKALIAAIVAAAETNFR